MYQFFLSIQLVTLLFSCIQKSSKSITSEVFVKDKNEIISHSVTEFDNKSTKVIHILVALCDNKYQGIVPVPKSIGNGQDYNNNLYWGCAFGIKTYFKKSTDWKLIKTISIDSIQMERLVFKHNTKNDYLIADAYNGKYIKNCSIDFLKSCSG